MDSNALLADEQVIYYVLYHNSRQQGQWESKTDPTKNKITQIFMGRVTNNEGEHTFPRFFIIGAETNLFTMGCCWLLAARVKAASII